MVVAEKQLAPIDLRAHLCREIKRGLKPKLANERRADEAAKTAYRRTLQRQRREI